MGNRSIIIVVQWNGKWWFCQQNYSKVRTLSTSFQKPWAKMWFSSFKITFNGPLFCGFTVWVGSFKIAFNDSHVWGIAIWTMVVLVVRSTMVFRSAGRHAHRSKLAKSLENHLLPVINWSLFLKPPSVTSACAYRMAVFTCWRFSNTLNCRSIQDWKRWTILTSPKDWVYSFAGLNWAHCFPAEGSASKLWLCAELLLAEILSYSDLSQYETLLRSWTVHCLSLMP